MKKKKGSHVPAEIKIIFIAVTVLFVWFLAVPIVTLLLKSLEERCMEQMDIRLNVTNSAVDYLAEAGFDAKYGARPLRRAIQSKIEDRLANELLEGKIKRGDQVQVQYRNKEIRFIVKDKKED